MLLEHGMSAHCHLGTASHVTPTCPESESTNFKRSRSSSSVGTVDTVVQHMECQLLEFINKNVIGSDQVIHTPFGPRYILYADYTASGRSLRYLELRISENLLPVYANTHTISSTTGRLSTGAREAARKIVLRSVHGDPAKDVVLFCGNGVTGAVNCLLRMVEVTDVWKSAIRSNAPPIVITGFWEHHSNILPWRESGAKVFTVKQRPDGGVDLENLRELLEQNSSSIKIGTFSAASNVTGMLVDVDGIATTLHRHGAYAFFDYATAGPYVDINVNSGDADKPSWKDAVFLSPHKFVGGPGTPGVLVVKRSIFEGVGDRMPPNTPGGGTVLYVGPNDHRYLDTIEEREEGGTPNIVGAVRCGLVFQLKDQVGSRTIMEREHQYTQMAMSAWTKSNKIDVLGSHTQPRLSVFSFLIRAGSSYLHPNFVTTLLNDLFGIQSRSGCSCAGPYAQMLMGIDEEQAKRFEVALMQGDEGIKPGFTRVNFSYFESEDMVEFIIQAVLFVAEHGYKFLPLYLFNARTGTWTHTTFLPHNDQVMELFHDIDVSSGPTHTHAHLQPSPAIFHLYLQEAHTHVQRIEAKASAGQLKAQQASPGFLAPESERLRWFITAEEALGVMCGETATEEGGKTFASRVGLSKQLGESEGMGHHGLLVSGYELFARAMEDKMTAPKHRHAITNVVRRGWAELSESERAAFEAECKNIKLNSGTLLPGCWCDHRHILDEQIARTAASLSPRCRKILEKVTKFKDLSTHFRQLSIQVKMEKNVLLFFPFVVLFLWHSFFFLQSIL